MSDTYTVLIREVVTTDRRVTIEADSKGQATRKAIQMAARGRHIEGPVASRKETVDPVFETLEPR